MTVTLYNEFGKCRPYRVHRLVAEAFLGPRPEGLDTRHGPGGTRDNRIVNLCYGTRIENEEDKKRDGTFNHGGPGGYGEQNRNSKLTEAAVLNMRALYANGMRQVELAAWFEVTQATVSQIVRRKTWAHI